MHQNQKSVGGIWLHAPAPPILSRATYTEQIHVIKECLGVRLCALGTELRTFWLKVQLPSHGSGEVTKQIFPEVVEEHEGTFHPMSNSQSGEVCSVNQMWYISQRHIRCILTVQIILILILNELPPLLWMEMFCLSCLQTPDSSYASAQLFAQFMASLMGINPAAANAVPAITPKPPPRPPKLDKCWLHFIHQHRCLKSVCCPMYGFYNKSCIKTKKCIHLVWYCDSICKSLQ